MVKGTSAASIGFACRIGTRSSFSSSVRSSRFSMISWHELSSAIRISGGDLGMFVSHPLTSRFIRTELDTWSACLPAPTPAAPVGHRSDWSSLDLALALAGTGDGAISCCNSCGEDVVDEEC
uniref:(northern house mosquito) hypothetical protein n=1 Tax=Culex pipiens TaxID=7175 RepID=A0A8D8JAI5_CULPI